MGTQSTWGVRKDGGQAELRQKCHSSVHT